jgi:hypothetical protein
VRLRDFSEAGFFDKGWLEKPIRAYYLKSRTDQNTSAFLLRKAEYFFTDTLTGCTFMAYGNNRHGVTVEHNNAFTNGPASMRPYEASIAAQNHPYFVVYNSDTYRQNGVQQGERGEDVVATVFGWRKADGWHFYACARINNYKPLRPRLIGLGAVEI